MYLMEKSRYLEAFGCMKTLLTGLETVRVPAIVQSGKFLSKHFLAAETVKIDKWRT